MHIDICRWEIVKLAALRCAPDGTRLRASAMRLLIAMLAAAEEQAWLDEGRLYTWPYYAQLTRQTALSKGSIGPARQKLIAFGLIAPMAGHKRGGCDPIASYEIFRQITRSPEQQQMAAHRHELHRRYRRYKEDQRAAAALNGHTHRFD
jgi:hypothetical protein